MVLRRQVLTGMMVMGLLGAIVMISNAPGENYASRSTLDVNTVLFNTNDVPHPTCPDKPVPGYPTLFPMKEMMSNWNPDDVNIPDRVFHSLCKFDYQTEFRKAMAYREAEVPFIVYNTPDVNNAVEKWSNEEYLISKFAATPRKTEVSSTNHFMYWKGDPDSKAWPSGYAPPNHDEQMTYQEWLAKAARQDVTNDDPHYYFRVKSTSTNPDAWVMKDLPFFAEKKSLFVSNVAAHRGINCRFGMPGVQAEAHYDSGRNMIAMLKGRKRYVIMPPTECRNIYLYGPGHPSYRHSAVNWANFGVEQQLQFPLFDSALATEMVLAAGEVLYLPSVWIHFIVSLEVNYQCNTRSGASSNEQESLAACNLNSKTGYYDTS